MFRVYVYAHWRYFGSENSPWGLGRRQPRLSGDVQQELPDASIGVVVAQWSGDIGGATEEVQTFDQRLAGLGSTTVWMAPGLSALCGKDVPESN
jgi:hypothetical protein